MVSSKRAAPYLGLQQRAMARIEDLG